MRKESEAQRNYVEIKSSPLEVCYEKSFEKISQNSHKKNCAGIQFL